MGALLSAATATAAVATRRHNGAGRADLSEVSDGIAGHGALRVDWSVGTSEEGGYMDLTHILPATEMYSCRGARYVSLWINNIIPQDWPAAAHFRLVLLDGSDCDASAVGAGCGDIAGLEAWTSFHHALDAEPGWRELRVDLPHNGSDAAGGFTQPGWEGRVGNNVPDAGRIKGHRLEWSVKALGDAGSVTSGAVILDHLSCWAHDSLLQQALDLPSWRFAVRARQWIAQFYQSPSAQNATRVEFESADKVHGAYALHVEYVVAHTVEWGGFDAFVYHLPGFAYYNLTGASQIEFWYRVARAQSAAWRAHRRLILNDASDCWGSGRDCADPYANSLESYYSSHHVLDAATAEWRRARVRLRKSAGGEDGALHTPRWSGQTGNGEFDADWVKAPCFELSIDGEGAVGSSTNGALVLDAVRAVIADEADAGLPAGAAAVQARVLPAVVFRVDRSTPGVTVTQFVATAAACAARRAAAGAACAFWQHRRTASSSI